jgi:hypothetical protein
MSNAIVLTHLGMGDMICINPAIIYFSKKYKNVYIFCKSKYFQNCIKMYEDVDNINIIKLNDIANNNEYRERMDIDNFIDQFDIKYDLLSCGIYKKSRHKFVSIPDNFYKDLGLELNIYEEYFSLPKSVYENTYFDSIIKNYNYVFIHGKTSTLDYTKQISSYIKSDVLMLNPSGNLYPEEHEYYSIAKSVVDLPFFDYVPLIQNALEVHMIGSSFSCLSKFIATPKTKKYLHNYNNCGISAQFFDGWNIINS